MEDEKELALWRGRGMAFQRLEQHRQRSWGRKEVRVPSYEGWGRLEGDRPGD